VSFGGSWRRLGVFFLGGSIMAGMDLVIAAALRVARWFGQWVK